jgi:hypothetical protein
MSLRWLFVIGALAAGCRSDEAKIAGADASAGSGGTSAGGSGGSDAAIEAGGTGNAGSGGAGPSCELDDSSSLTVKAIDLAGYPPYAIDGCKLAYVSAESGALVLRDLALGTEVEVAPAAESPRRPTLSGSMLAWQSGEGSASTVRISFGGSVHTAAGAFAHAGEPHATADAVVFTGWLGPDESSDTDVFIWRDGGSAAELVLGGPGQQRFADVSPTHVAVSDFSEDPRGVYSGDGTSLSDLVVLDRKGGPVQRKNAAGKQAFPMLGARGRMVFLEWIGVHPVPKFQDYTIRALELTALGAEPVTIAHVMSDRPTVLPVTYGNFVEWVERPIESASRFYRAELGTAPVPIAVSGLEGLELFAPAASSALTVIAVQPLGGAPTLRALTR